MDFCGLRCPLVAMSTYWSSQITLPDMLRLSKPGTNQRRPMTEGDTDRTLFDSFICHYGFPSRLHSDQGRNFENEVIKELCSIANIDK